MSQGLENAHFVSNRLLKWNGPGYFVLHDKKRCLMPFTNNKQEILRWWTPVLNKLYPDEYTPSVLSSNKLIKEFREKSKNENCVPLSDKVVPNCERPEFTEWRNSEDVPIEPAFKAKQLTQSRRIVQKHQARDFKDFMWQGSKKIFKKRKRDEVEAKKKRLKQV
jgi:hypothetical protein